MSALTLETAQSIIAAALDHAGQNAMRPLAVVVLDTRGAVKAAACQDGASLRRFEVAHGKAYGALALGMGSRSIGARAASQPHFVAAVSHVAGGALVPVPGGVLISHRGSLVGAVGISGDTSENDERAALVAISAAGLVGDAGIDGVD